MQSKMVKDKARMAGSVAQAADTHAKVIGEKAAEKLNPLLKAGEKLPDFALLATLAGRLLRAATDAMVQADDRNERELADDTGPRRKRDDATATAYAELTRLRAVVDTAFGGRGVEHLGFKGQTPSDPAGVSKQADDVLAALPTLNSIPLSDDAVSVDIAKLTASLKPHADALRAAMSEVQREEREAEQTLIDKQRAMAECEVTCQAVIKLIEGLLMTGGEYELSNRVRPPGRAPGDPEEPQPEPPEPTPPV